MRGGDGEEGAWLAEGAVVRSGGDEDTLWEDSLWESQGVPSVDNDVPWEMALPWKRWEIFVPLASSDNGGEGGDYIEIPKDPSCGENLRVGVVSSVEACIEEIHLVPRSCGKTMMPKKIFDDGDDRSLGKESVVVAEVSRPLLDGSFFN